MNKTVARNKKAFYNYEILDKFEAGIVLEGSEVKALRVGRVNLKDSYVRIIKGEPYLLNAHIAFLDQTNPHFKPDSRRARKLLLHKREIKRLIGKLKERGLTLIPLRIYFVRGKAKVELGLGRGKKKIDKREQIKKRDEERTILRHYKIR